MPRTITTPLYSVSLDLSKIYAYNNQLPNTPKFPASSGISILLKDHHYNQSNYVGFDHVMFEFKVRRVSSSVNLGYQAVIGNPVFSIIKAIFGYTTSSPYESLATTLAGSLLNTEYINTRYSGGGAVVKVQILQANPPNKTYLITVLNKVPKPINGLNGVSTLSWGGIIVSVSRPTTPPPCQGGSCPANTP